MNANDERLFWRCCGRVGRYVELRAKGITVVVARDLSLALQTYHGGFWRMVWGEAVWEWRTAWSPRAWLPVLWLRWADWRGVTVWRADGEHHAAGCVLSDADEQGDDCVMRVAPRWVRRWAGGEE